VLGFVPGRAVAYEESNWGMYWGSNLVQLPKLVRPADLSKRDRLPLVPGGVQAGVKHALRLQRDLAPAFVGLPG